MYWTSATKSGLKEYQLEKALLDGSQRSTIVTKMGMGIGLTIDYELGQLFWSNNVKRIIESATTNGKFCTGGPLQSKIIFIIKTHINATSYFVIGPDFIKT